MKRCKLCQSPLCEETKDGIIVRKENHKDQFIKGVLSITCECGYENIIEEKAIA